MESAALSETQAVRGAIYSCLGRSSAARPASETMFRGGGRLSVAALSVADPSLSVKGRFAYILDSVCRVCCGGTADGTMCPPPDLVTRVFLAISGVRFP